MNFAAQNYDDVSCGARQKKCLSELLSFDWQPKDFPSTTTTWWTHSNNVSIFIMLSLHCSHIFRQILWIFSSGVNSFIKCLHQIPYCNAIEFKRAQQRLDSVFSVKSHIEGPSEPWNMSICFFFFFLFFYFLRHDWQMWYHCGGGEYCAENVLIQSPDSMTLRDTHSRIRSFCSNRSKLCI